NGCIPEPSSALTTNSPDRTDNHPTPKPASAIGRSLLPDPGPLEPAKAVEIAAAQGAAPTIATAEKSSMYLSFLPKPSKSHNSIQAPPPQGRPRQHCVHLDFRLDAQRECSWPVHHFATRPAIRSLPRALQLWQRNFHRRCPMTGKIRHITGHTEIYR